MRVEPGAGDAEEAIAMHRLRLESRFTRRSERLLFAFAALVVAVHAAADSFVVPEPGTGPTDHLARGLVSLTLLGLAVAVYPRLQAGLRAAIAAALGALALEGAALAISDARAVGARGEDWTGFLLGPVGLVLLALAVVVMWRSRKPGRLRWLRRAGLTALAALGAFWLVVPLAMAILATHRPRAPVEPARLGRPYEQVTVRTSDGLRLAGWYVRSRNGAAVISYPTRAGKLPQARMLVRHGYGVLLVDARGYDGSQGDPNLFGWNDTKDINAAVAWLERQPDVQGGRIGGIGFSVGGEAMLQAAASDPRLRAVISEGAGVRSVREDVLRGPRGWFALPEAALQSAALAVMSATAPPPSLKKLVPRIAPRHVFFIYAGHGAGGEELNLDYCRAAHAPKALWLIPEANHTGGFEARPDQYEQRVIGFFDRALLSTAAR
jgi:dienelactone hydrolase